ncbi:MAG: FAD-dependent oxidoreductase [Bacteroidales bacterium]|nr:FAD-dependent oxidoreductase [Bacteroidales bacterium]
MKYIIVGGVAGGATVAARLRREDESAEIVLFERGEFISYANCGLPYYIGNTIASRNQLFVQTVEGFTSRYEIDIRVNSEVESIDTVTKSVNVFNLITGKKYTEKYDKLILSAGAEPIRPPIEGISHPDIFTLRNVPDTDKIKEIITRKNVKKAIVIGGGFIGLEMTKVFGH